MYADGAQLVGVDPERKRPHAVGGPDNIKRIGGKESLVVITNP
jgi:hypothetical protein